jgi:hypothetical protein
MKSHDYRSSITTDVSAEEAFEKLCVVDNSGPPISKGAQNNCTIDSRFASVIVALRLMWWNFFRTVNW